LEGKHIFAPKTRMKNLYNMLLKWVSKIKVQSYVPRTHEMKNTILSKVKGACASFQKYINCPNVT